MPARRTWQMAAAAVVLMALSSGMTYLVTRSGQRAASSEQQTAAVPDSTGTATTPGSPGVVTPRPRRSPGSGSTVLIMNEPSAPEVMYDQEITRLRVILDQRRKDLDTATVSAVEKSLKAIDQAITDARNALAGEASSAFLNEQLNRALEKKLGVLRRVALMPVGAS
jgi:hypothetical protein